ncbi:MAG: aminotransferase class III-fold pyridoxal phosphate-dependent enzyme [Planctomycetota bacterium]
MTTGVQVGETVFDSVPDSLGRSVRDSDVVRAAMGTIVSEIVSKGSGITGARDATSEEASKAYDELLQLGGEARGKGLLYPYIGSGLGNGALVELADGSVKWDMITGIGVNFFGHSDPDLIRTALEGATADVVLQGNLLMNEEAIRFAEVLVNQAKAAGTGIEHAFLCTGGALANENALKVCFQKNEPASRVIAFSNCFMGRTWAMAQIGDSAGGRSGLPLNVMADYMPFYDKAAARRMSAGDVSGETRYIDMCLWHLEQYIARYPKQHACFIFELVQGEGGFKTAPAAFHRTLMECCKANGIAVWDDEVQSFGRTTNMFACETLGVSDLVDVITVGKMSQVCAALYTADYNPRAGLLSGTFLGSSVGLKVGRRIIERLAGGDYYGDNGKIAKHHRLFREGIQAIVDRHPDWFPQHHMVEDLVSGIGGMCRFTPFGGDKAAVTKMCRQLYDDGVLAFYCGHGPFHVRFLPPLGVMNESDWAPVLEIVEKSLGAVASGLPVKHPAPPRPMRAGQ